MCLRITKDSTVQIASEDIVCYKVLRVREDSLTSPYQREPYTLGEAKTAKLGEVREFEVNALFAKTFKLAESLAIDEGLHSFANEEEAREFAGKRGIFVVCEAIIPAGTKYYFGEFDLIRRNLSPLSYESYVSEQIIVREILPPLESAVDPSA